VAFMRNQLFLAVFASWYRVLKGALLRSVTELKKGN
jgi:hypothetical protein